LEYSTIFEINKWSRFDLVDSPKKADLILRLDRSNSRSRCPAMDSCLRPLLGPADETEIPKGHTRISLLDPKTNSLLWADTHKAEGR
jgi:hypothetical protein